ncbi:MAG: glycosyltransferase [Syntrophaceae bacterium]|nr:glycosyltransferase [Syntrophaceae bacterium]
MESKNTVKLSVAFITYNQEQYVEQAVMSAVTQETSFPYEIVIGEDCSTDRTGQIIRRLQLEFPDKIHILSREKNLGPYRNALDTQKNCTGQYIAFLEGDDYWTDKRKLQKQVDFLDAHPEYVLCFSNACEFYDDGSARKPIIEGPKYHKVSYTLFDILEDNFIPTCTVVYRNGLIGSFPQWFTELDQCDWSTYVLLSKSGPIGYIQEVLAARRTHNSGLWSGATHMAHLQNRIKSLKVFDEYLNYEYHDFIYQIIQGLEFKIAVDLEFQGNLEASRSIALQRFSKFLQNKYIRKIDLIKLLVKYYMPVSCKHIFRKKIT